ncbi:bZIP transcription factor 44-like [Curcuma longa]|uniref:bZIP transcription factor 44-like n=1 Tax=Curcuma longa TaxID=136217 RepID=UPI003D9E42DF
MVSPSTVTGGSGSGPLQSSIFEENLEAVLDQRKRRRRVSNRESARRSRVRKQQRLDDLNSQLHHLTQDNAEVLASLSLITQRYFEVDAENSALRIQSMELRNRLMSLAEILQYCLNGYRRLL